VPAPIFPPSRFSPLLSPSLPPCLRLLVLVLVLEVVLARELRSWVMGPSSVVLMLGLDALGWCVGKRTALSAFSVCGPVGRYLGSRRPICCGTAYCQHPAETLRRLQSAFPCVSPAHGFALPVSLLLRAPYTTPGLASLLTRLHQGMPSQN